MVERAPLCPLKGVDPKRQKGQVKSIWSDPLCRFHTIQKLHSFQDKDQRLGNSQGKRGLQSHEPRALLRNLQYCTENPLSALCPPRAGFTGTPSEAAGGPLLRRLGLLARPDQPFRVSAELTFDPRDRSGCYTAECRATTQAGVQSAKYVSSPKPRETSSGSVAWAILPNKHLHPQLSSPLPFFLLLQWTALVTSKGGNLGCQNLGCDVLSSIRSSTPGYPTGALAGEGGHRSDLAGKGGGEGRRGPGKGREEAGLWSPSPAPSRPPCSAIPRPSAGVKGGGGEREGGTPSYTSGLLLEENEFTTSPEEPRHPSPRCNWWDKPQGKTSVALIYGINE